MIYLIIGVLVIGYLAIAFEHPLHINKAAPALVIGVVSWTMYVSNADSLLPMDRIPAWFTEEVTPEAGGSVARQFAIEHQLLELTGEIAGILFFLLGAMTIVEVIDAHEGFSIITKRVNASSQSRLMWMVAWLTFFLSSLLDNLTTTIVMISLLKKILPQGETRLLFAGVVVIAANAGGAWTVIGDVTTTMLWIKHRITPLAVMEDVFLPSIICLVIPLIGISRNLGGSVEGVLADVPQEEKPIPHWQRVMFLIFGMMALLSVPLFKSITHLPPFMGMMLALGLLWFVADWSTKNLDEVVRSSTGVLHGLRRVDTSSILFFFGILLAIGALGAIGTLGQLAAWLDGVIGNPDIVAILIGLVSAVVDNVPLVAAGIEMYTLPIDHEFWMLLAYAAGTGGSCLIIGSAAGVAAMGLEHIDFMWYLRRIGPWALAGYLAGAGTLLLQRSLFS